VSRSFGRHRAALGFALLALTLRALPVTSQDAPSPRDSVVIVAGAQYGARGLHRFLLGDGYRDLWTAPMVATVLDLRTFAGGLRPLKVGGGFQTRSLRLVTPDGAEWVFRSVAKADVMVQPQFRGTVVNAIIADQISASHPASALVAARLLDAAGVLHATPVLAVMPDDSLLGEFRKEFAGRLGMLEESPGKPRHHSGFAGAVAIIDSDTLLALLNRDPEERIDAPALLAARLMDMLFGDWDRHQGQWKWARLQESPRTAWLPVPRDRDKAFISHGGILLKLAGLALPNVIAFTGSYPGMRSLTKNSLEFDRRLLGGLEKPAWDSVAADLVRRITDSVIDDAVRALPPEYAPSEPRLALALKLRRDSLPRVADRFYALIAAVADIHATDAPDRATVTRVDDRFVEVRLESGNGTPYFLRRFDGTETGEIRIYLHGGGDTAVVTGNVRTSIPIRIIGGNGANRLIDSSRVGRSRDRAHLYDAGTVEGVGYGPDTLFNREPSLREFGELVPQGRDRGGQLGPTAGFAHNRDLGLVPSLGVARARYGFGRRPYSSRVALDAEYATNVGGFRIGVTADQRLEGSPVHFLASAGMSELAVINFHGFGNATPDSGTAYFEVRQRQWQFHPAVALALGPRTDLSLGPVVQYSVTDSTPNRFVSTARPYGFGRFGQAGLRLSLQHDTRDDARNPRRGLLAVLTTSFFPAVWDARRTFGDITAGTTAYLTFPIPAHPTLVLGAGAKRVFGTYPFHEAAFLGGQETLRSLDAERYAGDASVYGTAELRVLLARFAFILPMNVGVFGVLDAGRVYVDGASPGGWHTARGVGFWVGVLDLDPATVIRVCWRPGQGGRC
jgi:hypothetical protein